MVGFVVSDSEYDEEEPFECKALQLAPGQRWAKPSGATVVLTLAALAESGAAQKGVLVAETGGRETVLAALFPEKPTQRMRVVLPPEIDAALANAGTGALALSLVMREA